MLQILSQIIQFVLQIWLIKNISLQLAGRKTLQHTLAYKQFVIFYYVISKYVHLIHLEYAFDVLISH